MSSVDGLVSGMNTSDIIRQLMQLERQPVVRLQSRKTLTDKAISSLQALNTKFQALADITKKIDTSTGWSRVKATVTHPENLGVTVAAGTAPTSLTFRVESLAAAHQIYSSSTYASETTPVTSAAAPISISYTAADGSAATLSVTNHDGTLTSIAAAINAESTSPVSARVVKTSDTGDYRLEFTAKRTGDSSVFTVSGIALPGDPQMAFTVATQASDAEILFGSSGTPLSVKSATNTMTGVAPGVTLNLLKADPTTAITVDVARDSAAIADDVEKLVATANDILKDIKTLTAAGGEGKAAGALRGSQFLRQLQDKVVQAVSYAVNGTSGASVGLQLARDASITFDKAKFTTAYAADPVATMAMFTGPAGSEGIAQRLSVVSADATRSATGDLPAAIDSRRNQVRRIDDSIATWDVRLAAKEARLRRQFSALESALGASQQQGNWLAGQIASLPKYS